MSDPRKRGSNNYSAKRSGNDLPQENQSKTENKELKGLTGL